MSLIEHDVWKQSALITMWLKWFSTQTGGEKHNTKYQPAGGAA